MDKFIEISIDTAKAIDAAGGTVWWSYKSSGGTVWWRYKSSGPYVERTLRAWFGGWPEISPSIIKDMQFWVLQNDQEVS